MADTKLSGVSDEKEMAAAGSDSVGEGTCLSCSYEDRSVEGLWFCFDCKEHLCEECYRYHRKAPFSRTHAVKCKGELSCEEQLVKDKCSEICEKHDGKVLEYYCHSHEAIACSACMTLDHKNCDNVDFIPSIANSESTQAEVKTIEEQLNSLRSRADRINQQADSLGKRQKVCVQQILETVESVKARVQRSLRAFEEEVRKELAQYAGEDVVRMVDITTSCDAVKQEIACIEGMYKVLKESGMHCRLFLESKRSKSKIKTLEEILFKTSSDCFLQGVVLTIDERSEEVISQVKSIGTLGRKNLGNATLKYLKDISVRSASDTCLCKITGMTMLPENILAIADNQNAKIKLVDTSSGVTKADLKLTSVPWDITQVAETTIAVTLPEERKILILNTCKDDVKIKRHINVFGKCRGISFSNGKLILACIEPSTVEIMDLKGQPIQQFSKSTISQLTQIVLTRDGHRIIVSSCQDDGLHVLDIDGNPIDTYKDGALIGPVDTIEEAGLFFVCGWRSNNVLMVDTETRKFTEILGKKDGLSQPYSLVHDRINSRLYVGMRDVDLIKVFDVL